MSGNVGFDNRVCECGYAVRLEAGETRVCPKCFDTLTYLPPPRQSMKKAFATVPAEIRIRGPEGDIVIKTTPEVRYARVPQENEYETVMHKAKCELEESKHTGPPKPLLLAPSENGPGLRAQGGKYTEPGNIVIYCDHGWDD